MCDIIFYFMVTWIVHVEYDETTVPQLFRPLFHSGQALGARPCLCLFQRQCEHLAVLRSCPVPSSDITAAADGRRGVLELARRMMASFVAAFYGPFTLASSCNDEWRGFCGTGAERIEAPVLIVTWGADRVPEEAAGLVLSATTTVWLPSTPPQRVFHYLCDGRRRGEWDTLANGAAVQELGSVDTGTGHRQPPWQCRLCPPPRLLMEPTARC
ncbi:homeobox-leucine zipper protein ROC6-like [Phragmites australis]|uniref:homeobox-leucine zipper protein ROC6-like n=1 Tax=Phragmites australis TaxID=29695 RepID=UPI002D769A95|nr:homeobox-leucine zipper protein ROC6-like [Phragmites australis]